MKNVENVAVVSIIKELEKTRFQKHFKPGWVYHECKKAGMLNELNELEKSGELVELWPLEQRKMLTLELVPVQSHNENVRSKVSKEKWDEIRKEVYQNANYCCEFCGGIGKDRRVDCHEIWDYDDESLIQKLNGFVCLCQFCHEVKHMGYANTQGRAKEAKKHLANINGWTETETNDYVKNQFELWTKRSLHKWTLDTSYLESIKEDRPTISNKGQKFKVVRQLN